MVYDAVKKRQCLSIVGPRHSGKSSLLQYLGEPEVQKLYHHYGDLQDRIFILTDWREYLQETREDFFYAVCDQIIMQSRSVLKLQASEMQGGARFKRLLEDIRDAGYRPVLLMDAFDRVTRNPHFDPDFFSFLRSLAGIYDLISYVTASIKPLYEVCHSDEVASSPFFNIFHTCLLGPLTSEEARELIILPAQRAGMAFTAEEVAWLLARAGRHPFFVQVACRHLFAAKMRQQRTPIDLKLVQDEMYHELLPHFANAWKDLNERLQNDLTFEASQQTNGRRKLPELSESGLFRKYIRETAPVGTLEITVKEVKDALDHLDDTETLGQCELSKMHYITRRLGELQAMQSSQVIKKGALVRDFLKAAFERMRVDSIRTDGAAEWRLYNILWYHYFKYSLPNPRTAARLGISPRQFYREQERALQELLNELLALEAAAVKDLDMR